MPQNRSKFSVIRWTRFWIERVIGQTGKRPIVAQDLGEDLGEDLGDDLGEDLGEGKTKAPRKETPRGVALIRLSAVSLTHSLSLAWATWGTRPRYDGVPRFDLQE